MLRKHLPTASNISSALTHASICMILALVFFSFFAVQTTDSHAQRIRLQILEVFVDEDSNQIEITGEHFDLGPNELQVTLGDFGNLNIITHLPDFIVVKLPPGITPGDYLLKVFSGPGNRIKDEESITVGAVGPQGDTGDPGDPGQDGPQGPPGAGGFMIFSGGSMNNLSSSSNTYASMVYQSFDYSSEASAQFSVPEAGTLTNLRVDLEDSPGPGANRYDMTVRLNGADTSLACTIAGNVAVSCSDTTSCVDISAGDLIALEADPNSNPSAEEMGNYTIFTPGATCMP